MKEIIKKYSIAIKEVLIEKNLIAKTGYSINNLGFKHKNILLVSDKNLESITKDISKNIQQNNVKKLILDNPKADEDNINLICNNCQNIDLVIAVGSGTINDLCKLSSFKNNIPYIIFATAPSMNGYASANASIAVKGHKKTIPAHQALAIYCDLDIMCAAPINLIKAGIGDSLCYWTCQFDWMLSHLILNTKFNQEVFDILAPYQEKLVNFEGNDFRDKEFIKILCEILIISGFAMYLCKGSYPASQGEHLIAHFLEMKYPKILKNYFHGQQIAVTTLTMLKIQENFLGAEKISLKNQNPDLKFVTNLFDGNKNIAKECLKELEGKIISNQQLENINKNLKEIQNKLQKTTISLSKMNEIYKKFKLPRTAKDLALSEELYQNAIENSYLIRDRLTSLDFL